MITRGNTYNNHKYFCLRCKDRNWLIQCADGCGKIIFRRGKNYCIRKFYNNHKNLGINHHNFGKLKGSNNPFWKGGKWQDEDGYWHIRVPNHPFKDKSGYVLRHRLVYEEYYNCILLPWIEIHHIDKNTENNNIENLMPVTKSEHIRIHNKGNEYRMIDRNGTQCSDPKCLNPNKTYMRKLKSGKLRPVWLTDGKGNIFCKTCYTRLKRSNNNDR